MVLQGFATRTTRSPRALCSDPCSGAAVGAASTKKGQGWAKGLVLGMLAGGAVGAASTPSRSRRVLTVRFDPITRAWAAYDGGLVTWLKSELEPTA